MSNSNKQIEEWGRVQECSIDEQESEIIGNCINENKSRLIDGFEMSFQHFAHDSRPGAAPFQFDQSLMEKTARVVQTLHVVPESTGDCGGYCGPEFHDNCEVER